MNIFYELKSLFGKKINLSYDTWTPKHSSARGIPLPTVLKKMECYTCKDCVEHCPTSAIKKEKDHFVVDYGKCLQCGLCTDVCPNSYWENSGFIGVFALSRSELVLEFQEGTLLSSPTNPERTENQLRFQRLTKKPGFLYREVAASGNNTVESELNASFNSVFDSEREGIRCVASPKHADAIVYSGPVGPSMETPLAKAFAVTPEPKVLIACGTEAISGGLFAQGKLPKEPDLWIAGDPPRPDVILSGFRLLLGRISYSFVEAVRLFLEEKKKSHGAGY